jgi:hypothetical protein
MNLKELRHKLEGIYTIEIRRLLFEIADPNSVKADNMKRVDRINRLKKRLTRLRSQMGGNPRLKNPQPRETYFS